MSPMPVAVTSPHSIAPTISGHDLDPAAKRQNQIHSHNVCEGWMEKSLQVGSISPSSEQQRTMSLQALSQARASHGRQQSQWIYNNESEKSFHSFPPASMSDVSMERGVLQQKEQGSGVKKDLLALLNLISLVPFISIILALYALFATIFAIISAPIRLCVPKRPPQIVQLTHHLLPALNLHFKSSFSSRRYRPRPLSPPAIWPGTTTHFNSSHDSLPTSNDSNSNPSLLRLLLVLFFSPILALPIACSAFVVAIFWMLSALTTDETAGHGAEDGDFRSGGRTLDDGRWLAKRLRRWWVRWLCGEVFERGKSRTQRRASKR